MSHSALQAAMLADAPAVYWPLDDANASQMRDISGNARHGVYDISGSPSPSPFQARSIWTGSPATFKPTKNNPYEYGRSSATNPAYTNPGSGDFLMVMSFKGEPVERSGTNNTFNTLYGQDVADTGNGIILYAVETSSGLDSGTLRCWYAGSVLQATTASQGGKTLFDGKPHMVAVEKRGGNLSLYLDGVVVAGPVSRGTPSSMGSYVYIGSSYSGDQTYSMGAGVSDVVVWTGTIPAQSKIATYYRLAMEGAVPTPLDFGTLGWCLDASQELGYAHGVEMSSGWSDRAGNGLHFTKEGTTEIVADGRYGKSAQGTTLRAAQFLAGSDRFVRSTASMLTAGSTFFIVFRPMAATPGANQFIFDTATDGAASRHWLQWMSTGAVVLGGDGAVTSITTPTGVTVSGRTHVVVGTYGASARLLFDQNAAVTGNLSGDTNSVSPIRVGSRMDATTGFLTPMDIFEIGAYTTGLSVANQDALHQYLLAKYSRDRWSSVSPPSPLVMG